MRQGPPDGWVPIAEGELYVRTTHSSSATPHAHSKACVQQFIPLMPMKDCECSAPHKQLDNTAEHAAARGADCERRHKHARRRTHAVSPDHQQVRQPAVGTRYGPPDSCRLLVAILHFRKRYRRSRKLCSKRGGRMTHREMHRTTCVTHMPGHDAGPPEQG